MAKKNDAPVVGPSGKPVVAPFVPPPGGTPLLPPPSFAPPGSPAAAAAATARAPAIIDGPVLASAFELEDIYLKGSDIPTDKSQAEVKVLAFVSLPNSRSPLVAQIEETYGKKYLPLNKTNIKQIQLITQQDDLRCILGRTLVLVVYPVNNPQTKQMTRGIYVGGAR